MAVISGGRLNTSATTLAEPATCLTSVVNSEMKERWRVWHGDLSALLLRAPYNGLWFVHTAKGRPLSMWRKCLIARKTPNNFQSKAEYFISAAVSFLEKNAMGAPSVPP